MASSRGGSDSGEAPLSAHLLFGGDGGNAAEATTRESLDGREELPALAAAVAPSSGSLEPSAVKEEEEERLQSPAASQNAPLPISDTLNSPIPIIEDLPRPQSSREAELEQALADLRSQKDVLDGQYRSLVNKLTTMRNTLGEKLKQDADELDRRAAEIAELRTENADLTFSSETLRAELVDSNSDNQKIAAELSTLRSRVSESTSESEGALREALDDVERLRSDLEDLESNLSKERMHREKAEAKVHELANELDGLEDEYDQLKRDRDTHRTAATNLSSVLEEFQTAKEKEMAASTSDLRDQLQGALRMLAEFKTRALTAESKLTEITTDSTKMASLEKDVKDKSLLIGKLRHEAVILNEHLTESLKRLRNNASDTLVDRRLVSNVLISFLCTSRGDPKRFEMLQLLGSVLTWSDDEREKAGLQRTGTSGTTTPGGSAQKSHKRGHTRQEPNQGTPAENETFSNLWVEYLLREATSQSSASVPSTSSLGMSPRLGSISPNGVNGLSLGSPPASPTLSSYSSSKFGSLGRRILSPTNSSASLPLSALSPSPASVAGPSRTKHRSDSASTTTTLASTRRPSFSTTAQTTPGSSVTPSLTGTEKEQDSYNAG